MTRRPSPLRTHCKRGHEFTPANTLLWKSRHGDRLCRECEEMRRDLRVKRMGRQPCPAESGLCRKGLHRWIEENLSIDRRGHGHCIPCRRSAMRALYHRSHAACIVKGCDRATAGERTRTYICPKHRIDPPAWIFRAGLRVVGIEVVAA